MSPCEVSTELGCTSPQLCVRDMSEGDVENAVSEGVVERIMEPLPSSCTSSPTIDRGEDDSGDGVVGIENGRMEGFCDVPLRCVVNTEVSIETIDLGKRLDELDVSLEARRDGRDRSSREGFCNLGRSSGLVESRDGITGDLSRVTNDAQFETVIETCGPSFNDPQLGDESSRLNGECLDKCLCESGVNSCLTNIIVEGELCSGVQEVCVGDKSIGQNVVKSVSEGTMDDESSRILVTQDPIKVSGCVEVPNLTYVGEDANKADNTGNDNCGTHVDKCVMKLSDTGSLPLRRSSRSRKTVQHVQSGKNTTRYAKKASKISLRLDLLSEATKRKRSSFNRSMCSYRWGTFEKLSKYFHVSNEVAVNQAMDPGTRKKKNSGKRGEKDVLKVVENSAFPEIKQEIPRRPIRLKVTFGKREELGKGDGKPLVGVDLLSFQPHNDDKSGNFGSIVESSVPKEIPRLMQCNNSTSKVKLTSPNLEICSVPGNISRDDSSQLDSVKQDGLCAEKFSEPGTSPDSEVIDQLLDSTTLPRTFTSLHDFVNKEEKNQSFPTKKSKSKRSKKEKIFRTNVLALECLRGLNRAKISTKGGYHSCSNDNVNAQSENHPSKLVGTERVSMESLPVSVEGLHRIQNLENVSGIDIDSGLIIGLESVSGNSCKLLTPGGNEGKKNSKGSRTKGKTRTKSKSTNGSRLEKDPSSQQKGKKESTNKHKVKEAGISGDAYQTRGQPRTGNLEVIDTRKTEFSKEVAVDNGLCPELMPNGIKELPLVSRLAWVCCDDCLKWRCIPARLADVIDSTNCGWTCKDNQDKAFADCSIPQEKSNAEINAELQISDEEDGRDRHLSSKGSGLNQVVASQPSTWMLIKSNLFLHRNRKTQTMDEIMVCHCKPPIDGSLGCGSHCLNRMLNIECVQGTCPCGDFCSNQQFQRRKYVELSWLRCGKKGYGLQVLEDISEGQFLIEYVGEVLDLQTYEARQKDYAAKGHKHFYFMTLNGNEVIDASAKGNLGRFVNHSCDPNCCTEKWVVNGEICVGLFALRNIKKGEELTFDYNYVRVFGAAAKKCHCGSLKCRGYIGGDPLNAEIIVQEDSDEEFPEPVVVNENGEVDHSLRDMMAKSSSQNVNPVISGKNLSEERSEIIVESGEIISKIESSSDDNGPGPVQTIPGKDSIDEVRESTDSTTDFQTENMRIERVSSVKIHTSSTEHTTSTPTSSPKSDVRNLENTFEKSLSGSIDSSSRVSEVEIEGQPHARPSPRMKIPRPLKPVKNRKSSTKSTTPRPKVLPSKPKRLLEGSASCHHEDVEKSLNQLLDGDGGICKKKDASKGYLKLLLLTAASGDSGNGGSIQSNRILSMILDAMLKTKSRGVLQDIVNKNGLQMLHNMMKLYRSDFKKIPILRKLLKVLEFLAEKEILTRERINVDSLHPGVESFSESILYFTEHDDNQVHQIARSFRDRWIPHAKRFYRSEKNDRMKEFQRGSNPNRHFGSWREQGSMAIERPTRSDQSGSMINIADTKIHEPCSPQLFDGQNIVTLPNRPRKRKSKWDQPSSPIKKGKCPDIEGQRIFPCETKEENMSSHLDEDMIHNSDDDAPPGFSYPHDLGDDIPPGFLLEPGPVSLGILQTRFNPKIPVAYGIPFSVVQRFGTPQCGTADSWEIAPSIPFQPFPPLPPYPHDKKSIGDREEVRQGYHTHLGDQDPPSTSTFNQNIVGTNHNMSRGERGARNVLGKRYRDKNWVSPKHRPPWVRNLEGWGFKGKCPPHPKNGSFRHKHGNGSY